MIGILGVVAGLIWVSVLNQPDPNAGGCLAAAHALAAAGTPVAITPGRRLPPDGLDAVPPAPPQQVVVQVLNANGQRSEASIVAAELAELGFVPTAEPSNDPLHPAFDLRCHGEIRFGIAGQAAARTLSLAVPCAELVRDGRADPRVDLALGTEFTGVRPPDAARQVLRELVRLGQPPLPSHGGQAAGAAVPTVDPDLLRATRQVDC